MLQSKIRRLMEEDPVETREVFDGGDWLQIRMDCAQSNWSEAVIESDQLMIAMNRIDWSQPGTYIELDEPETIGSFMSEMP